MKHLLKIRNWKPVLSLPNGLKIAISRLSRSRFARRLIPTMLAFLILTPLLLIIFRPQTTSAAWFDDNYAYRQKFSFTHNADITTPRRITITIDTASLISAGVMRSDCADTRFTDINGNSGSDISVSDF